MAEKSTRSAVDDVKNRQGYDEKGEVIWCCGHYYNTSSHQFTCSFGGL